MTMVTEDSVEMHHRRVCRIVVMIRELNCLDALRLHIKLREESRVWHDNSKRSSRAHYSATLFHDIPAGIQRNVLQTVFSKNAVQRLAAQREALGDIAA